MDGVTLAARHLALTLAGVSLAGTSLGCAGSPALAAQLVAAAQPGHLPLVVSCWEKQVEASGFQGEYVTTVDFTVEGEMSRLRDARVTAVTPDDARGQALATCVAQALNGTTLPRTADGEGPGFAPGTAMAVKGYAIAFVAPSPDERGRAEAQQAHVLLGPRANRCEGLYRYAPPRDVTALSTELEEQEKRAQASAEGSPDQHARALQKVYDIQLELRERLRLDAAAPEVPAANRQRLEEALALVDQDARRTGALIRCEAPPLPR
ncbi:hypothetical protein [Chondromyces apiculatus]|nr:hypothetical protein [Chondromyces apiculatus]